MSRPSPKTLRHALRGRRGSRRAANHDEVIAQGEGHGRGEADVLITDPADFASLIDHVRQTGSFAYDTEFIGEESYWPRLCVIQIATRERVALIDPLVLTELSALWDLLADPAIEKIVHAGAQDLEPVVRHLGREPANVFDTQIVAGFLGMPYPLGLRALVEAFTGTRLGKALTFTRWDARPLSAQHRHYAADDVRFLPSIAQRMSDMLTGRGMAAWARAECDAVFSRDNLSFHPESVLTRLIGNRTFRPREVGALRELVRFREQAAEAHDLPPRSFLRDDVLLRLAQEHPHDLAGLERITGLPRPIISAHGADILSAIARGQADPGPKVTQAAEETPAERFLIDGLWSLVCARCHAHGVDPGLVGTRRRLAPIVLAHAAGRDIPRSELLTGWRGELVGRWLLQFLSKGGRAVFRFDGALRDGAAEGVS